MRKINISDVTLKKLSEDRAVSLLFREKSAIAGCADALGADAVELPRVKKLREDSIIYKTIAKNVKNAVLAIPVGFTADPIVASEEHFQLHNPGKKLKVGDRVKLIPGHCCSTVNLHDWIYVVEDDRIVDRLPITARKCGK